jgi:hypothetical protein
MDYERTRRHFAILRDNGLREQMRRRDGEARKGASTRLNSHEQDSNPLESAVCLRVHAS